MLIFVFKVVGSVPCVLYCSNRPSTWQHGSTCWLIYFTLLFSYKYCARASKMTRPSTDDDPQTRESLFSSLALKVYDAAGFSDLDDVDGRNRGMILQQKNR